MGALTLPWWSERFLDAMIPKKKRAQFFRKKTPLLPHLALFPMLATKEICKVRRDAVGGKTKAYAYAVVERNNKVSARVIVLDADVGQLVDAAFDAAAVRGRVFVRP